MKQRGINIIDWLISKNLGGKLNKDVDIPSWILGKNSGGGGVPFAESPVPTVWETVQTRDSGTATNDYGTWTIECVPAPVMTTGDMNANISYVFDNNDTTASRWSAKKNPQITLTLPDGVSIKPTKGYLKGEGKFDTTLEGYNEKTSEWEQILQGFPTGLNFSVTTNSYFTKFRLTTDGLTVRKGASVTDLLITEGIIKVQE